jgi:hypothetical protein
MGASYTGQDNYISETFMIIQIFFDAPPNITPAVHKVFAILGGLDLDHPRVNARGEVGYLVTAPRELSQADLLAVAADLAQHFGVEAGKAHYLDDFSQVALAVSRTADAIAATFGVDTPSESAQDFDPAHATTDELLYGLLHWSFDGNNMSNMETMH